MKHLFVLLFLLVTLLQVSGQQPVITPATDTTPRIVTIENAKRLMFKKIDSSNNELSIGAGDVVFRDGSTRFFCDSAVKNKNLNIIEAFGHVHIIDSDTIHTYSDYLIYHIDTKLAVLKKRVKLTNGESVLTTDDLDYDTNLRIGTYKNGGKIVSGKTTITSREAVYYADLKDVYFKKNVKLKDPGYDLSADSLLYNTETQLANFITDTYIKDTSGTEIVTSSGYYDLKNKTSQLTSRSTIKDKSLTVTGDELALDDKSGIFEAKGNAIMIDTAQGLTLLANDIKANRENNTFLATLHPLMILKQDKDSIYITADTLFSGIIKRDTTTKEDALVVIDSSTKKELAIRDTAITINEGLIGNDSIAPKVAIVTSLHKNDTSSAVVKTDTSDVRFFIGYHRVRIFADSMQAVCDSLFYSAKDSVFRLYKDPILWANKSQVTGDTIYLHTKNKKADHLNVIDNAFMINMVEDDVYNQMKGSTITAYFKDGAINYTETIGSPAESVYYVQDEDSAYVGMNTATARQINMYFKDKALNRIVMIKEPSGTFTPPGQISEEKKKLSSFKWQENRRPKTRYELFEEIVVPPVEEAPKEPIDGDLETQ